MVLHWKLPSNRFYPFDFDFVIGACTEKASGEAALHAELIIFKASNAAQPREQLAHVY